MSTSIWQILRLAAGPLSAVAILVFTDLDPANPLVTRTAAVAAWMALWWLTEAVPLAATALLPLALFPALGVASGKSIAGAYINSTIFLFLGGFLLALAMERWQLHRRIALRIIGAAGGRPDTLVLGFMLAAALLSMWISNTATAIMMLPMALAILGRKAPGEETGAAAPRPADQAATDASQSSSPARRISPDGAAKSSGTPTPAGLSVCLLLGIAYAASIGGIATPVGTPPNLILMRVYDASFPDAPPLSFGQWMLMGLPFAAVMLGIVWVALTKILYRRELRQMPDLDARTLNAERAALGKMSREERMIQIVFVATAILWCFRTDIQIGTLAIPGWSGLIPTGANIDDGTVAIAMTLLLFLIPVSPAGRAAHPESPTTILDGRVFRQIPWSIVLLFGGGFALADGFVAGGLAEYLVGGFAGLGALPIIAVIALIACGMTFLTELTSNTASTQMVLPVLAVAAVAQQIHPLLFMLPATLAASMAFMMPVATPPNAIVFSSEVLRVADMAKTGLWLNFAGILLVTAAVLWLASAVFGFSVDQPPDWLPRPAP
ncbi:MAG: SLC13 family permease [bacterium]|nr:SLC13 family permease [bacterium]